MSSVKEETARERLEAIHAAIVEARGELDRTAEEVESLNRAIAEALGRIEPEPAEIEGLEARREELKRALERWSTRVEALEGAIPEAEKAARVEELDRVIEERAEALAAAEEALARWRMAAKRVGKLSTAAEDVREALDRLQNFTDEALYLSTLVDRPIEEPFPWVDYPSEAELDGLRRKLDDAVRLQKWGIGHQTPWRRKWEELRSERDRARREKLAEEEFIRQSASW